MITKTSAEAQNQFGQLLDTVQREPVIITRHGRPVAFIFSPRDMEELVSIKERRSKASKDYDARRKKAKESKTPATAGFSEEDASRKVHEERAKIEKKTRGSR